MIKKDHQLSFIYLQNCHSEKGEEKQKLKKYDYIWILFLKIVLCFYKQKVFFK